MSKASKFEDLTIFQKARELCKEVYKITKEKEFSKDTRFVQQIHASAGSVMDNIAEGYERDGNKEFINFLYIAKGSREDQGDRNFHTHNKYNIYPQKTLPMYLCVA